MEFDAILYFVFKATILFGMTIMFLWNAYGLVLYFKWYRGKWRELTG